MEQIIIRKATSADIGTLLEFEQGVIRAERPFDSTLQNGHICYYDIEQMIRAENVELVVAQLQTQLIGCGDARIEQAKPYLQHARYAHLGFMYVDPAYRGKEVNQRIIEVLKQWAVSKNITEIRLNVYQDNQAAIRAYEKSGFTKHMVEMRCKI